MHPPEDVRVEARLQLVERPVVGRPGELSGRLSISYRHPATRRSTSSAWTSRNRSPTLTRELAPALLPVAISLHDLLEVLVQRLARRRAAGATRWTRLLEPRRLDRLQQVVDRVHLERLDGVLVERRDEDDVARRARSATMRRATSNPVRPGHLDVEEDDVGPQPLDERRAPRRRCSAWPTTVDAADLAEQEAQLVARQLLVVDDHGAKSIVCSRRSRVPSDRGGVERDLDAGARAPVRCCSSA